MRRGLLAGFGALLTVAGVIWTLQGLGYIGGSVMTGVSLWAVVGPAWPWQRPDSGAAHPARTGHDLTA
jgi:hypothetical protein